MVLSTIADMSCKLFLVLLLLVLLLPLPKQSYCYLAWAPCWYFMRKCLVILVFNFFGGNFPISLQILWGLILTPVLP